MDIIINLICMSVKYILYRNKNRGQVSTLVEVKLYLKSQMETEEYNARIQNKEEPFLGKWSPFYKELKKLK